MKIKNMIQTLKEKDPAFNHGYEIILYPFAWCMLFHSISHFLFEHNLVFLSKFVALINRFFTGIEIHPKVTIGDNFFIDHGTGVVIGETAVIGDNVTIYQCVTLGGTGKDKGDRHPKIGNNVTIGAGAKILGNIKIGDNCKVGANSVVLKEVKENSTVVGIPARVVCKSDKKRGKDCLIEEINDLKERLQELEKRVEVN